jgi:hypothetical protein
MNYSGGYTSGGAEGFVYMGPCALLQELQACGSYKEWRKGVELENRVPSLETFQFVRNLALSIVAELLGGEIGLAGRYSVPSAILASTIDKYGQYSGRFVFDTLTFM